MPVLALIESAGLTQPRAIVTIAAVLATIYYFRHDSKDYFGIPKSPTYSTSMLALIIKTILKGPDNDNDGQEENRAVQDEKYRPLFWSRNIAFTGINISSPALFRDLLVDGQQQYREGFKIMRSPFFTNIQKKIFLGPSIANASGEDWKWRRRLMVPLFQPRKLVPQLLPYVVERTNMLIDHIRNSPNKDGLDMDELLAFTTFDIICKYLFGKAGPDELDFSAIGGYEMTSKAMKDLIDGFARSLPWTYLPLIGKTKWAQEPALTARMRLKSFIRTAILQCVASEDNENNNNMEPVVKILSKAPQFDPTTEEGLELLISETVLLIFGGHETTAHTISFILGNLAKYPDIQSKVANEVHDVFGFNSIEPNNISTADLSKLTYITAVIREVGRMHPIFPIVMVETTQDIEIAGHNIPANTMLFGGIRACSMDPTVYAEPFNFDPSRWLLEESDAFTDLNGGNNSTKLPEMNFSMGTHVCLGRNLAILEMRAVVAMLSQKFEISFKEGYNMTISMGGVMKPKGGMWLVFKERI